MLSLFVISHAVSLVQLSISCQYASNYYYNIITEVLDSHSSSSGEQLIDECSTDTQSGITVNSSYSVYYNSTKLKCFNDSVYILFYGGSTCSNPVWSSKVGQSPQKPEFRYSCQGTKCTDYAEWATSNASGFAFMNAYYNNITVDTCTNPGENDFYDIYFSDPVITDVCFDRSDDYDGLLSAMYTCNDTGLYEKFYYNTSHCNNTANLKINFFPAQGCLPNYNIYGRLNYCNGVYYNRTVGSTTSTTAPLTTTSSVTTTSIPSNTHPGDIDTTFANAVSFTDLNSIWTVCLAVIFIMNK